MTMRMFSTEQMQQLLMMRVLNTTNPNREEKKFQRQGQRAMEISLQPINSLKMPYKS